MARQGRRSRSRRGKSGNSRGGFLLTIQDGRHRGEEYNFETEATIGRIDENSIKIIDESISRHHVRIWGKRGVFLVEDSGSSNGTRLNGKLITQPEVLKDGDYITPGVVNIMFNNLDLEAVGEQTAVIKLTEKQKEKLDFESDDFSIQDKIVKMWGEPKGKVILIGVSLFFTFLLFMMLAKLIGTGGSKEKAVPDESEVVTQYREAHWADFLNYSFGHCFTCIPPHNYSAKISFSVPVKNTRAVLTYAAGMIEKDKEVAILLNGKRIQYAEWAPPNRPKYNYLIDLYRVAKKNPGIVLKTGENLIEFRNLLNYPDKHKPGTPMEDWIVFSIRIKMTALPKANISEAEKNYSNAKQNFENRELNPANYRYAIDKFFRVIDLLELAPLEKPDMAKFKAMYRDSLRTIKILNRELDTFFRNARARIIEASRYANAKQRKKAIYKLLEELKRFPEDDLRKQKLTSEIEESLL